MIKVYVRDLELRFDEKVWGRTAEEVKGNLLENYDNVLEVIEAHGMLRTSHRHPVTLVINVPIEHQKEESPAVLFVNYKDFKSKKR